MTKHRRLVLSLVVVAVLVLLGVDQLGKGDRTLGAFFLLLALVELSDPPLRRFAPPLTRAVVSALFCIGLTAILVVVATTDRGVVYTAIFAVGAAGFLASATWHALLAWRMRSWA